MNLGTRLCVLVPGLDLERDVVLRDDGTGPYIKEWRHPGSQPSQNEIDAVTQQQIDDMMSTDMAQIDRTLPRVTKALALVMLDEINILRAEAGLDIRTMPQLKNAIKSKL